jgi:hypothetical protein
VGHSQLVPIATKNIFFNWWEIHFYRKIASLTVAIYGWLISRECTLVQIMASKEDFTQIFWLRSTGGAAPGQELEVWSGQINLNMEFT